MATPKLVDQLIPTKELAGMFDIPYQTLMANIASGKINAFQPSGKGGKQFVYLPEMKKFMQTYRPHRKPESSPSLFSPDNSSNKEIAKEAAELMLQGNRLFEKAYNLLKEIA